VEQARRLAELLAPLVQALFIRTRHAPSDQIAGFRQRLRLDDVVGVSPALATVLREVEMVAPLDVAVLITGETGTGKTQIARVIHDNGPRRSRRFLELNCSAFPDNLVESELFGVMPGAYTGAIRSMGKVAAAQHGTLFLDEVGLLSWSAQGKLLQFLDTKQYFPVGSSTSLTANVRIIAATNEDLERAIDEKRFRSDLFFRLRVLCIRMPSLSERRADIVPLARYFCDRARQANRLPQIELSPGALRAIEATEWEGNARDLDSAIQRATIYAAAAGATSIEATHVFPDAANGGGAERALLTFQEQTRRFQSDLVGRTLDAADWNVAAAARSLDLTRAHVYNLINTFGLVRQPREKRRRRPTRQSAVKAT
jgi:Nif-specific regulatory protein